MNTAANTKYIIQNESNGYWDATEGRFVSEATGSYTRYRSARLAVAAARKTKALRNRGIRVTEEPS